MSVDVRLQRIEREVVRSRRDEAAARARIEHGDGTLSDYRQTLGAEVDVVHASFIACMPLFVALREQGFELLGCSQSLAYRPNEELPEELADFLAVCWEVADQDAVTREGWRRSGIDRFMLSLDRELSARCALLRGDRTSLSFRNRAWVQSAGRWELSPEVRRSAAEHVFSGTEWQQALGHSVRGADSRRGVDAGYKKVGSQVLGFLDDRRNESFSGIEVAEAFRTWHE